MRQYFNWSLWTSIVLIAFGLISGVFKSDFTTWFFFGFFCVVAFFAYFLERR